MSIACPIPSAAVGAFMQAAQASSPRDFAIVLAGLSWGYRITELLRLQVRDVADDSGRIRSSVTIQRANLKNGMSARRKAIRSRTVPVSDGLRVALTDYLFSRFGSGSSRANEPLFAGRFPGEALCRRHAQRLVQSFAMSAGLSPDRTWSCHSLRKTYAKTVYEVTKHDIIKTQRALGHADCQTTQRYLPLDEADVQDAIAAAQASLAGPAAAPHMAVARSA